MRNLLQHVDWLSASSVEWLRALLAFAHPRIVALAVITLYQQTLSPDHSWTRMFFPNGFCPHDPTCSQYARREIAQCGFLRGTTRTLRRLLHCHPWSLPADTRLLSLASSYHDGRPSITSVTPLPWKEPFDDTQARECKERDMYTVSASPHASAPTPAGIV